MKIKKNILFLANSTNDLLCIKKFLNKEFNIIWLTYNKGVVAELKKKKIKNINFSVFANSILNKRFFFINLIIDRLCLIFGIKRYNLLFSKIRKISQNTIHYSA